MVLTSPLEPVEIPETDILTYLFPQGSAPSEDPLWLESSDPENSLSPKQALNWVKRLAIGLDRKGIQQQEAVMILTPNHIFVPAAYLGIVGSRRIFSAANPIYTVSGTLHVCTCLPLANCIARNISPAEEYWRKNHTRPSNSPKCRYTSIPKLWIAENRHLPIL
jgi:acyl-CoA synthetase (AMP-forming)/AMP-acid ligase II